MPQVVFLYHMQLSKRLTSLQRPLLCVDTHGNNFGREAILYEPIDALTIFSEPYTSDLRGVCCGFSLSSSLCASKCGCGCRWLKLPSLHLNI